MSASWKVLMSQHDKLVGQSMGILYERVKLLCRIEEVAEFQKEYQDRAGIFLDGKVRDTCCLFSELRQIIKLFPKKEQWENGHLGEMQATTARTISLQKKNGNGMEEEKGRQHLSWKEKFITLERKYKELQAAHKQLERDYRELRSSLQKKVS